jgi:hypothetical protein
VPGLSHRTVLGLLNDVIRQACNKQGTGQGAEKLPLLFSYQHASGAERELPYQPHVELEGYISDDFARDLDGGKLRFIELIKSGTKEPFGGDSFLMEDKFKLVIEASKNIPPTGRLNRLKSAWRSRINDFDKARIHFVDPNNKSHQVDVDLERGAPEQKTYVRSAHLIGLSPPLDQSCDRIQDHLANEMLRLLKSEIS